MADPTEKGAVKRKRSSVKEIPKKRPRSDGSDQEDIQAHILSLETEISSSRKNYNNISTLIEFTKKVDDDDNYAIAASVALCRVFLRLLAAGNLSGKKGLSEKDAVVVQWLKERLAEYKSQLLSFLSREELASTALTLCMRTLEAEGKYLHGLDGYAFPKGFLLDIISELLDDDGRQIRDEFVQRYFIEYDDIKFYSLKELTDILKSAAAEVPAVGLFNSAFDILSALEKPPASVEGLKFFVDGPGKKHPLQSLQQHKRAVSESWLALMGHAENKEQRKRILDVMATVIAPWFTKPELLADFLTDSYNSGGSVALLALSGVFYLIQERNIDYPSFYSKLYSLLDRDILHSKYRGRFFRLLDTFLASSHLPAVLVASFIKRLARLSLNAPPSAIVFVVPWIYNLFMRHPLCTFMIHRESRGAAERARTESEGFADPFLPDEADPTQTKAIDSCLWELVQLQSHYHPNVATIAKIISEQFTKQSYNLEDFLDHSYSSLLDAELSKEVKKTPVVEFQIPKRIFLPQDPESGVQDGLLVKLWDFTGTDAGVVEAES